MIMMLKMLYCYIFSHNISPGAIKAMELSNDYRVTHCQRCYGLIKIWRDYDCKDGEYWEKEI